MSRLILIAAVASLALAATPDPADGPSVGTPALAPTMAQSFALTWYSRADYPISGRFRPMFCTEPGNSPYLYVIGGRDGEVYTECFCYDAVADTWRSIAPLLESNCNHAAVWWTDDGGGTDSSGIYIFGRYTSSGSFRTCYHWTKETNTWSSTDVPEYPGTAYSGNMAATIGDSVFLIHRLSTSACEMHRYSIREGTWDSRPAPAFPENYYGAVCAYDGQIWQLGGWQDSRRFQRYSPQTGVWDSLPDSPANTGGNSPGLAASGGRIWLWGGGAGWVPTRGVASYDKSTNAWYPDTDMPEAIMAGAFGILDSAGTPGLHGACGYRTLAIHYRGAGLATAVTESQATPAPHRGIVVSPNPARGRALVSLASPAVGAATSLTVFDATGRSVRTILVRGRSIVLDGLEPGIYLLRLDAAGSATGRLVVLD